MNVLRPRDLAVAASVCLASSVALAAPVKIGLIEPVPWYRVGVHPNHPGNDFGDLPRLLDTAVMVLLHRGRVAAIANCSTARMSTRSTFRFPRGFARSG